MNLCRSCGLDFGSVKAFDAHRVGRHAYTYDQGLHHDPPVEDGRRCLDATEMRKRGFVRNARERWSLAEHLEAARDVSERNPEPQKPGREEEAA